MPLYNISDAPRTSHLFGHDDTVMRDAAAPTSRNITSSALAAVPPSNPTQQTSHALQQQSLSEQTTHSGPPSVASAHFNHSLYFIEHLFPSKLWRILDDAERCGYDHVISWVDNGTAFQIHDRKSVIPILEKYFNISKYKSFLRQLQAYGFQRALPNPMDDPNRDSKPKRDCYRGKWSHKLFRRDKLNLCNKMTRDGKSKQQDKEPQQTQHRSNNSSTSKILNIPLASKQLATSEAPSPTFPSTTAEQAAAAAMTKKQQEQQSQYHRQLLREHLIQQQQSSSTGQSSIKFNDARYVQQHKQYLAQQANTPAAPPSNSPYNGFSHPSFLTRIQQQQEEDERHRQQLTMQLNQLKEQQFISSILAVRANATASAPVPETAHNVTSSPSPTPPTAGTTILGGVNYNETKKDEKTSAEISSTLAAFSSSLPSGPRSPKVSSATDAVSAAVNELRQAEMALIERHKRLIEAQEKARQEAEVNAKVLAEAKLRVEEVETAKKRLADCAALVAGVSSDHQRHLLGPASTTNAQMASSTTLPSQGRNDPPGLNERKKPPLTSFLQDLDNAFRSTVSAATTSLGTAGVRTISNSNTDQSNAVNSRNRKDSNDLKITEEELLRVKNEAAVSERIQLDHRIHNGNSSSRSQNSGKEVLLARLKALEQFRLHGQQNNLVTATNEQQSLLLQLALADREHEHAVMSTGHSGGNANTSLRSQAVREAIRNAALGLVTGNNIHNDRHLPQDLRYGTVPTPSTNRSVGMDGSNDSHSSATITSASAVHKSSPGLLSQEMVDVFAKTAAAAIAKNNETVSPHVSQSGTAAIVATTSTSTLVTAPTSPSHPASNSEATEKNLGYDSIAANKPPNSKTSGTSTITVGGVSIDTATPDGAADSSHSTTNAFLTREQGNSSDELEAARALICIPGSVAQSKGEAIRGHWELVRSKELRADGSLSKQLPEAVTRSAQLSCDSYQKIVKHMAPPGLMRIPDGWDPKNEPIYLVVDPMSTSTQVLSQTSTMQGDAGGGTVHALSTATAMATGIGRPKHYL